MKRKILLALAAIMLAGPSIMAQQDNAEMVSWYKEKYEQLVRNVGADGVGVETILDKWARIAPEDTDMLEGKFSYYFVKCQSQRVAAMDRAKYLGDKPVLTLKDSTGRAVNYFNVTDYSDSLFAMAEKAIDLAIALSPNDIRYRCEKISSLMAYEKEEPDMAVAELYKLIDLQKNSHPAWTVHGAAAGSDIFEQAVQEYCVALYKIGSPSAYEYFKAVSEKMNKMYPKNSIYLDNLGSYWKMAKKNDKKALGYYNKALKLDPEDKIAKMNIRIIQSAQSSQGRPSK